MVYGIGFTIFNHIIQHKDFWRTISHRMLIQEKWVDDDLDGNGLPSSKLKAQRQPKQICSF
jgi:hypothetical protein